MSRFTREEIRRAMVLYAVTDRAWVTEEHSLYQQVEEALAGGATCIQLREKELGQDDFLEEAIKMKEICHRYHVPFIINDNVEIALKCGADGIHVGQSDMAAGDVRKLVGPDMMIGVSAKTVEQALYAQENGADYLGVGAMFHTSTKKDATEVSYETALDITKAVHIPVVGIGGISKENMLELTGTGIDGVALVSAIFGAKDIERECKELKKLSESMTMRKVLTIAGSDCSGGAGIQADLKTITAHKMYGMSAICALTAQNTTGVCDIMDVTPEFLAKQLDCIFTDIRPDAVKIGMVSNKELIHVIAEKLKEYHAENVVLDPVMVSTSGSKLISEDAIDSLKKELFPLATVITPNIPETAELWGKPVNGQKDMVEAAKDISTQYGCGVLVKGGHMLLDEMKAADYLYDKGLGCNTNETKTDKYDVNVNQDGIWFQTEKVSNTNTHGTGCTLSSAIACNLAAGNSLPESIQYAKNYLTGALKAQMNLGKGSGPLNHVYDIHIL